jgi:hypothetical protein
VPTPLDAYWRQIEKALQTGDATEHTHRPALAQLIQRLQPDALVINEPKRIACGAPDLAIQRTQGGLTFTIGYIETKDVDADLNQAERSEQLQRYRHALPNLILTNYREFRWYVEGELRGRAVVGVDGDARTLLLDFLNHAPQPIADADALAVRMARYAHLMRDALIAAFQQGQESGLLHDLRQAVAETLLPDLDQPQHLPEFADMLAQTLAYGLFAARCYHADPKPFTRAVAAHEIPRTNPFLRQLFDTLNSPELETEPFVAFLDDLVYLLHCADMHAILQQFAQRTGREDAVVHFYETFLHAYDPRLRELRGVYYTPEPVVDYLVRSVHRLLRTEFGLSEGLATLRSTDSPVRAHPLYILDPACGTGSFLAHILQFIRDHLHAHGLGGLWNDETRADLMQRLFGFELLMAPYVIAHLKLGLLLDAPPQAPRLGVYLTNTLELPSEQIPMHLGPWRILSEEAIQAAHIKRETPILVVIGNPPYSGHSANQVEWLETLLRRDYYPKDARKEQNPKMLLDDYVKFIRWAQWRLEQTGQGILAFITNHSYLDNPTFRGMRRALLEAFDALYLLDLHGNARRQERAPDGSKDENVFDIQQGVAILIAVKNPMDPRGNLMHKGDALIDKSGDLMDKGDALIDKGDDLMHKGDALIDKGDDLMHKGDALIDKGAPRVFHAELWGRREAKYAFLKAHDVADTPWQPLNPQPPLYLFTPFDATLQQEYEQGWLLTDIFRVHSTGVKTHRDHFVIDFDRPALERRIQQFRDLSIPDATIRQRFALSDTRDWKLTPNRERLASDAHWQAYFQPILYRPFDVRWIYYTPTVVELPREEVMGHMLGGANVGLFVGRYGEAVGGDEWNIVHIARFIVDTNIFRRGGCEVFPLYLYHQEVGVNDAVVWVREVNLRSEFVAAFERCLAGEAPPSQAAGEAAQSLSFRAAGEESALADAEIPRSARNDSAAWNDSAGASPEAILAYIYAILHAPSYRARYAEFLRRDFPRIPLPKSATQFQRLAALGQELIQLHLLRHPALAQSPVKFPVAGSNTIEKGFPRYDDGRVWINKTQYFEGVSEAVWRFAVGGYQVCDKWLKDRRGRTLSNAEVQTYRQIVYALSETLRLMEQIDLCWREGV